MTPDYFKAIGAPLKRGRLFTDLDQTKAPPVALINEAAVRRWFPDQDPIGKRVLSGGPREKSSASSATCCSARRDSRPSRNCSCRTRSAPAASVRIVVRAQGDPLALAPRFANRSARSIRTCRSPRPCRSQDMVSRSVARPRFYMSLLTLFAAVALVLSATGIFGVMSYAVAQQSKEIGIRMALGARAADVLRSVVGRAIALAGLGVIVGIIAALASAAIIRSQLFGVTIFDPHDAGIGDRRAAAERRAREPATGNAARRESIRSGRFANHELRTENSVTQLPTGQLPTVNYTGSRWPVPACPSGSSRWRRR